MKPGINLISVFSKVKGEDGSEYYSGSLNAASLKKAKEKEIDVVLMPVEAIPKSLVELIKKSGNQKADLLMFGAAGDGEGKGGENRKSGGI